MGRPASCNTLAAWLGWLETLSPAEIDLGLERVACVLQRLPIEDPGCVIHVAGTNGKGSSAAMLEALYLQRNDSVGCYTSPHLQRYNERIRIAGNELEDEHIVDAFEQVEAARGDVPLTYFEYGTLAALCAFSKAGIATEILEIGLGGRLDAVNAVEPSGGIITNVSVDHVAWLGEDIDSIAVEKAGILRSGKPFVFASVDLPQPVLDVAAATGAMLSVLGRDYDYDLDDAGTWTFSGQNIRISGLQTPALPGAIQLQNAAGVLALVEALGDNELLNPAAINSAFAGLQLPGRLQRVEKQRTWLFDVAHNRGAAEVLRDYLATDSALRNITCVIGILDDKQVADIVEPIRAYVGNWIAVTAGSARAIPAAELGREIEKITGKPCQVAESIATALEQVAGDESGAAPVLVTGSFFTVGPALASLSSDRS